MTDERRTAVTTAWESQQAAIDRAQKALNDVEAMANVLRSLITELREEIGGRGGRRAAGR